MYFRWFADKLWTFVPAQTVVAKFIGEGMQAEQDEIIQLVCHGNTTDHRSFPCERLGVFKQHLIFVAALRDERRKAKESTRGARG